MKTLWEILVVVSVVVIFMGGLVTLGDKVFETQTLSSESLTLLNITSSQVQTFNTQYGSNFSSNEVDPYLETDLNDVDGFVQEYRDAKGKIDQLKEGLKLTYKFPDLIIYLIPGVEVEDLQEYIVVYRTLVIFLLMFVIILGVRNSQYFPQF